MAKVLKVPFEDRLPAVSTKEQEREAAEAAQQPVSSTSEASNYGSYQVLTVGEVPEPSQKSFSSTTPTAKKRVTGVMERVKSLIAEGRADSEIIDLCVPMYTAAGKPENVARNLLKPYVAEIRKLAKKVA